MRQSLMLINGRLLNQAARVGDFEPMAKLTGDDKPASAAIELAYLESLSRMPTTTEVESAVSLISAAANRREGIADLRWMLLNSLEFRFIP
jgi:hypothetical protein